MTKTAIKSEKILDLNNNRIPDKIVTLLVTCGVSSLRAVNNLSKARESCTRAKKKLIKEGYIKENKRKYNGNKKTIVKGTSKLIKEIEQSGQTYNTNNVKSNMLGKRLISAEITSNFIRMNKDIYLGEAKTNALTKNYFVPYTKINEFLTSQQQLNHDTKQRLISGIYVGEDMLYPIYYVSEDKSNFYYFDRKSNISQQSRVRKLPNNKTNIIYLMSKVKHKDILKRFILNEEKRSTSYTKFYRFDTQANDTFLIPAKTDGTYEITRFAVNPEINEAYKNKMSNKLEKLGYRKIYSKNYFHDKNLWCIYMPVIKVNEIRECIKEIKTSGEKHINIGLITFKENINLIIDYINEVLVNQNNKKVTLKIMNDLSSERERKAVLKQDTFELGE